MRANVSRTVQPATAIFVPITALLLLGGLLLAPTSLAQVTNGSTLRGTVCAAGGNYPAPMDASYPPDKPYCYPGLSNATVRLTHDGTVGPVGAVDRSVASDQDGVFAFGGLTDGTYHLAVSRAGYEDATLDVTVKGDTRQDLQMTAATVVVGGHVRDADGKGIADAMLNFCCGSGYGASATTSTDAAGHFEVKLQAGSYSVSLQAPGFEQSYDNRFLDGSAPADFTLQRVPPQDAVVKGRAADQAGHPAVHVRIDVYQFGGGCCYAYDASTSASPPTATASPVPPSEPSGGGSSSSGSGTSSPGASGVAYRPYYSGSNYTFTDDDGRYSMRVYSGQFNLNVNDPDFAPRSYNLEAKSGAALTQDLELKRYPAKTAHLTGHVVGSDGQPAKHISVSTNALEFGRYECSQYPADQQTPPSYAEGDAKMAIAPYPYPNPGCAITVREDGSFDGMVTPGYTVLNIYADGDCTESYDQGYYARTCKAEYLPFVLTTTLGADKATDLTVTVQLRPGPDATIKGYVLDDESQATLVGAQVEFSMASGYGYGVARTDKDGSYGLELRSGWQLVTVRAEGHLHWEGLVEVQPGENALDVTLKAGEDANSCCIYYAQGMAVKSATADGAMAPAPAQASAPSTTVAAAGGNAAASQQATRYKDLNGGLGPYDAAKRPAPNALQASGAPAPASGSGRAAPAAGIAVLAVVAALAFAMRRRL